jgi:hypothetical protein
MLNSQFSTYSSLQGLSVSPSLCLSSFRLSSFRLSSLRLLSICFLLSQFSFSQKKEENIGTEVVNVVKPYSPTISDAFKIKETPELDDEGNAQKEKIKFTIFSFPVASTFTPYKGKAEGVEKEKQATFYNNYATFGGGNYGVFNGELLVNQELNNNDYLAGILRHLSSQGAIKGVELNNKYFDTSIDLAYGIRKDNLSWNVDLGYQNQIYNWYGLPADFGSASTPIQRENLIRGINPQQSYNNVYIGSRIQLFEGVLKKVNVKFNRFSDAYGSVENRFYVKPSFNFIINDNEIKTDVIVDYLSGSFDKNYWNTNTNPTKYGNTSIGIAPSYVIKEKDWTVQIGASLFYNISNQNKGNKLFIYPQINASYKVVGDLMIFYTGANGELKQNTYSDFVESNPFLSPTLIIAPTDSQYDFFAGLKGKIVDNVSYNLRGSYVSEKNKALIKSNDYSENSTNQNFAFGNSMSVFYDDIKTLSFYGELKTDINNDVTIGLNGTFNSFTKGYHDEVWNLPIIQLNGKVDFNITEKWYAGVNAFYVGERKDQKMNIDIVYIVAPDPLTLAGYFDLNAHVGFKYSDRLTAFLKGNNITNKAYQKWLDYPVQGLQIVVGANYKFDF